MGEEDGFVPVTQIADSGRGITYRAAGDAQLQYIRSSAVRASMSYVTGTHALKIGMSDIDGWVHHYRRQAFPGNYTYQVNNGVPTGVTYFAHPFDISVGVIRPQLAIFAQDQ